MSFSWPPSFFSQIVEKFELSPVTNFEKYIFRSKREIFYLFKPVDGAQATDRTQSVWPFSSFSAFQSPWLTRNKNCQIISIIFLFLNTFFINMDVISVSSRNESFFSFIFFSRARLTDQTTHITWGRPTERVDPWWKRLEIIFFPFIALKKHFDINS